MGCDEQGKENRGQVRKEQGKEGGGGGETNDGKNEADEDSDEGQTSISKSPASYPNEDIWICGKVQV
jgi:hypothetical protein